MSYLQVSRGTMVRNLVVATDLAEDSERALDWILKNVYKPGDDFHIVHVAKLKARPKPNNPDEVGQTL